MGSTKKTDGPRKVPEDVKKAEAALLRPIYERWIDEKKQVGKKITQAEFAEMADLGGTQGLVWQYISGHIPLNIGAAAKFARVLGVPLRAFSPRLAAEASDLISLVTEHGGKLIDDPIKIELLEMYEKLSPGGQETLYGNARRLYLAERPAARVVTPIPSATLKPPGPEVRSAIKKHARAVD